MATSKKNKDYTDWIESYTDGLLSEAERKQFEDRLNTDDELAYEYNLRNKLATALREASEYKQTGERVSKVISETNSTKISYKVVFSIAAVLIILIGIFAVLKFHKGNKQQIQMAKSDSSHIYKPMTNKAVHLSKVNYYRPFSSVNKNEVVTILEIPGDTVNNADSNSYLYKMILKNAIIDETVNQLYFHCNEKLLSGKYIYLNDSLTGGHLLYQFKSLESKSDTFLINADSLRVYK